MSNMPRHSPANEPDIKVIWEHVEEPQWLELLRTAIRLILADADAAGQDSFDKGSKLELNEGAPVERTTPTFLN